MTYDDEQWNNEMQALKDVGIDYLIMGDVANHNSDGPCEKISVNSTTVIKNDIASGLKNSRSIFLQYPQSAKLSSKSSNAIRRLY